MLTTIQQLLSFTATRFNELSVWTWFTASVIKLNVAEKCNELITAGCDFDTTLKFTGSSMSFHSVQLTSWNSPTVH